MDKLQKSSEEKMIDTLIKKGGLVPEKLSREGQCFFKGKLEGAILIDGFRSKVYSVFFQGETQRKIKLKNNDETLSERTIPESNFYRFKIIKNDEYGEEYLKVFTEKNAIDEYDLIKEKVEKMQIGFSEYLLDLLVHYFESKKFEEIKGLTRYWVIACMKASEI